MCKNRLTSINPLVQLSVKQLTGEMLSIRIAPYAAILVGLKGVVQGPKGAVQVNTKYL